MNWSASRGELGGTKYRHITVDGTGTLLPANAGAVLKRGQLKLSHGDSDWKNVQGRVFIGGQRTSDISVRVSEQTRLQLKIAVAGKFLAINLKLGK